MTRLRLGKSGSGEVVFVRGIFDYYSREVHGRSSGGR